MKFYTTYLLVVCDTALQNILALEYLRSTYGEPQRDEQGSYWDIPEGDETVQLLLRYQKSHPIPCAL
jgi:hypothetical protein